MISFREVTTDDARLILDWRTSTRVTRFMSTDVEKNEEAQKNWIISSYKNPCYYHWIIQHDKKPVGLINLSNYS